MREHLLGRHRRVDTVGFYRYHRMPTILQEVLRVDRDDTRLVRLRDVGKDHVDHREEHSIPCGMAGILHNSCDQRNSGADQ